MSRPSSADPTWSDQALLAAIVHQSEDAIIGMDLRAVILAWNAGAERMYGYTEAEAVGRHVSMLYPDDRHDEIAARVSRVATGERLEAYETVRRHRDGSLIDVSVSLTGLRDHAGELSGLAAIHRDISSRRRAEEARREAESRYRSLVEQIPAVTYMQTFDPVEPVYVSHQVEGLLGYSQAEWMADPGLWPRIVDPQDRERVMDAAAGCRRGEAFDLRYRVRTKAGETRWIHDRAVLLRDQAGEPRFIQGLMFDITDTVREHEDLVSSLSLTQATLDSTTDGILVVDRSGRTEGFNQRFVQMWGIPDELLETRDDDRMIGFVLDQLVDPDAFVAKIRALYEDPEASSFDTIAFRDGRVFERYSLPQRVGDEVVGRVWSFRDVTERRHAEEALRDAESRYRTLIEQIPAIVYNTDFAPDGRWGYVSPQVEALLGYTPQEWMASPELFEERLHPEDRDRYLAEEALAQRSGSLDIEFRLLARDGSVRWFRDVAAVVERPGADRFLRGVMFDITEAREASAALQRSEERYRTLWEDSPISLWEEDLSAVKAYVDELRARGVRDVAEHIDRHPDEAIVAASGILAVDANLASLDLFGAETKDQLLGPIAPYAGEEARLGNRETILAVARGDRSVDFEVVNTTLTGERLDLSLRWVVAPGHETTYGRVLLSLVDVSARRRAEEELRATESRYRTIVESSLDAIVTMDAQGVITGWNPQAEVTFGWPADEVVGRELAEVLIPPGDRAAHRRGLRRFLDSGRGQILGRRIELTALHRDGSTFPIELAVNELHDAVGVSFSGFVRDITDRVRAEAELRDSLEALRRTTRQRQLLLSRLQRAQEEERERIGADIHDDSIQAMVAVGMRLAMLRRRLREPSEEDEAAFRELERTVEQAVARLRHLLFDLRPPALDREGLAAALRLYLEEMQRESSIRVALESWLLVEPPVETRIALYRVAQEALANVRKHAKAERVEVLLQDRDRGVLVRIRDDGKGFDGEQLVGPRPGHLGVTAMQERTEAGGGWLRIATAPGAGTTVEFWMPVEPEAADVSA